MLPNFLIVGAAKSGTTSLYNLLYKHPEVFLPVHKEPRFFISEILETLESRSPRYKMFKSGTISSFDEYQKLFENAETKSAIGEASAEYLFYHKIAISNIKKYLGKDVKIIIILRNPIKRAYSSYFHLVKFDHEHLSFELSLKKEEERLKDNWGSVLFFHKHAGLYYEQVKDFMDNFKNVKIFLLKDLSNNFSHTIKDLYNFVDIDTSFIPHVERKSNVGIYPKYEMLHKIAHNNLMKKIKASIDTNFSPVIFRKTEDMISSKIYTKDKPIMNEETKRYLQEYFKNDILKLQKLINRDLSSWLL